MRHKLVAWSAGVRGPDVLKDLDGLEATASNQLVVGQTLQTTRDDNIFVIGDCAYLVPVREKRPIPPRAQAAHQQASHLLKQMKRLLNGEPVAPFVYRDFGSLVSLGGFSTIGSLMGFVAGKGKLIEGYVARLMYRSLYKMHETALHGPLKVGLDTVSRLMTRRSEPHVKLH
jgi:NADH:ubiquinone reductase (H+-translocating)